VDVVRRTSLVVAVCLGSLGACQPGPPPFINVTQNPNSVLSVIVSFAVPGGTSAHVVATAADEKLTTPEFALSPHGDGQIAVLGLKAQTAYTFTVEGTGSSGPFVSAPFATTTEALPADLQKMKFTVTPGSGAPAGYYLVSGGGKFTFAVDGEGTIRWYRGFGMMSEETKMHEDGTFTTYVGASAGWQPVEGAFLRYTPDGNQVAMYQASDNDADDPGPIYTDGHELLITKDTAGEHLHMIGYMMRPFSSTNATPTAWHEIIRSVSADGTVESRWKSWNYFDASDELEPITLPGASDLDHANAIDIDQADGNYVVSFRDVDTLLKIDYQSGAALWQLGGVKNQFTFVGDPLNGFQGQHSVRMLGSGHVLVYDDGLKHTPPESRAVEYALDTNAKTATMVWQYRHSPALFTPVTGSVERLSSGHTLVAFAWVGTVTEVDAGGGVVWEGVLTNDGKAAQTYRIRSLPSLYSYQKP
jgi:hypothetical protein